MARAQAAEQQAGEQVAEASPATMPKRGAVIAGVSARCRGSVAEEVRASGSTSASPSADAPFIAPISAMPPGQREALAVQRAVHLL